MVKSRSRKRAKKKKPKPNSQLTLITQRLSQSWLRQNESYSSFYIQSILKGISNFTMKNDYLGQVKVALKPGKSDICPFKKFPHIL
jgi:hypothetical protein